MSKRGYISRYLFILKKLKLKPYSSFDELQAYLDHQFGFLQMQNDNLNIGFSKRTLQRDIREITNLFGIDIEYSKSSKGYYITSGGSENMNFLRMIESFDLFNSLNLARDLAPFIYAENQRPQGTENLYGLLHAVKNKLQIKFTYKKFWEEDATIRKTEPYALKEFKNRWYAMAKDLKDGNVKSFALDRMSDLEVTTTKFISPDDYSIEQTYRYCFGIISPIDDEPQEIILSFNAFQGKYIKSLPLHETQEILEDNQDGLLIKLKLYVTLDLVMELLSFGDNMKVVKPESLIRAIRKVHEKAFRQY